MTTPPVISVTEELLAELEEAAKEHLNGELCDVNYRSEEVLALIARIRELSEAQRWIPVSERLPEYGVTVLAYYMNSHNRPRRIRAQYIERWTVEASDGDPDVECVEYSEQDDTYYLLEGWYECIDNWDEYMSVAVTAGGITHWRPLPSPPKEGV